MSDLYMYDKLMKRMNEISDKLDEVIDEIRNEDPLGDMDLVGSDGTDDEIQEPEEEGSDKEEKTKTKKETEPKGEKIGDDLDDDDDEEGFDYD